MEKTKLEIELPVLITAEDYHDFEHMQNLFRVLNEKIHVDEIGFGDGVYHGVIHTGSNADQEFIEETKKRFNEDVA